MKTETEAKIRVMLPQVRECQEPPEAGGGEEGFSPTGFRVGTAWLTP